MSMNRKKVYLLLFFLVILPTYSVFLTSFTKQGIYLSDESESNIYNSIVNLTSFSTRYAGTVNGNLSAEYIYNYSVELNLTTTMEWFSSPNGELCNIVVDIESLTNSDEFIVIGAHYDSINTLNTSASAPGANDNGASVAVLMELARLLNEVNLSRNVKIIFFGGEEIGRLGSLNWIVSHPELSDRILIVMILDMIAWGEHIIINYNPDSKWASDYIKNEITLTDLKFECLEEYYLSDQTRFWDAGFSALLIHHNNPLEYPYYHTEQDTVDKLNMSVAYMTARLVYEATLKFANDDTLSVHKNSQINLLITIPLVLSAIIVLTVVVYILNKKLKKT
ncbi:MAG: M28 family metallopeptidase [Candidatus Odinarchaeia archaeon]